MTSASTTNHLKSLLEHVTEEDVIEYCDKAHMSMLLDVRSSEADPIWTVHPTVSPEGGS